MSGPRQEDAPLDVAVIGAGLSGLATALLLQDRGLRIRVIEASAAPGGRIRSLHAEGGVYLGDLGQTWVWPTHQPSVARWIKRLGLATYPQHETGDALIDLDPIAPPRRSPLTGQHGVARLVGGPQAMVNVIAGRLREGTVQLDRPVRSVNDDGADGLAVRDASGARLRAARLVAALPPRVAATSIDWSGLIADPALDAMRAAPTWMASQAKAVVVYDRPFWRARGLSGRVASRVGPLVEMHDHSGPDGTPAALFGFVGWPPGEREPDRLRRVILGQLVRCFGQAAGAPLALHVEDWARDRSACTEADRSGPVAHSAILPPIARLPHANGRIVLAGAETSTESPGLIDGALEAAQRAAAIVVSI